MQAGARAIVPPSALYYVFTSRGPRYLCAACFERELTHCAAYRPITASAPSRVCSGCRRPDWLLGRLPPAVRH